MKAYQRIESAIKASAQATPRPRVFYAPGHGYYGLGDTLINSDGVRDVMCYGKRGATILMSELQAQLGNTEGDFYV